MFFASRDAIIAPCSLRIFVAAAAVAAAAVKQPADCIFM